MNEPAGSEARGYEDLYEEVESPLMQQVRREAYGEDIGQHSWVTAEELREDVSRLGLSPASRLLDLGCGPAGPLTFVVGLAGVRGTGLDLSAPAIAAGRTRAASLRPGRFVLLPRADFNEPPALAGRAFWPGMSRGRI